MNGYMAISAQPNAFDGVALRLSELRAQSRDPLVSTRLAVAKKLADFRAEGHAAILVHLTRDPEASVRKQAVASLMNYFDPELPALIAGVDPGTWSLWSPRQGYLDDVFVSGLHKHLPVLRKDSDPDVRRDAARLEALIKASNEALTIQLLVGEKGKALPTHKLAKLTVVKQPQANGGQDLFVLKNAQGKIVCESLGPLTMWTYAADGKYLALGSATRWGKALSRDQDVPDPVQRWNRGGQVSLYSANTGQRLGQCFVGPVTRLAFDQTGQRIYFLAGPTSHEGALAPKNDGPNP